AAGESGVPPPRRRPRAARGARRAAIRGRRGRRSAAALMPGTAALAALRAARRSAASAAVLLAALAPASLARAHTPSVSYSAWERDAAGGARVQVRVSQLDLSRIGLAFAEPRGGVDPIARYLQDRLRLSAGGRACTPEPAAILEAAEG